MTAYSIKYICDIKCPEVNSYSKRVTNKKEYVTRQNGATCTYMRSYVFINLLDEIN